MNPAKKYKYSKFGNLFIILLIIPLLTNCGDNGLGLILTIMGAGGFAALLSNADSNDSPKTSTTNTSTNSTTNNTSSSSSQGTIKKSYDGLSDDLLTAGLGQTGLTASSVTVTDVNNPSSAEIRKSTIINQYQASQDRRSQSGYGRLYGPAVASTFVTPTQDGKVAGKEYLAYSDDGSGRKNVTMMVQIPKTFSVTKPCLVVTASPESRGIYGAIAPIGEWGLKNRCAVAYTDKGAGNGVHDLTTGTVNKIDGSRTTVGDASKQANFKAEGTTELDLAAYNSTYPYRVAQKHVHSQQNPEAGWGQNVLDTINFAFSVLNLAENFGNVSTANLNSSNTIVIAAGGSSGGNAVLRAAELDSQNLIDGVLAVSPTINPQPLPDAQGFTIRQGSKTFSNQIHSRSLFDVITYQNLFQPCASANNIGGSVGRCNALRSGGFITATRLADQVAEAQQRINNYGILESSNSLAHLYNTESLYVGLAVGYANAYGRFSVVDNLCGYSYAATSSGTYAPIGKTLADLADDFQTSSGLPPSSNTVLVNNAGNSGRGVNIRNNIDDRGNADEYFSGALCIRQLVTGTTGILTNSGVIATGTAFNQYRRVQTGIQAVLASGDLGRKPGFIVHGRDDALAHVNITSRAYYGLNKTINQASSRLIYLEIKNAHYFDGLNQQYGIINKIPLSYYVNQALDRLYGHLLNGSILPASQVIPTTPLSSLSDSLKQNEHLPAIDSSSTCPISFANKELVIPEC